MSQFHDPFEVSGDSVEVVDDDRDPGRRRTALALGALAVTVLGAGGYLLLGGGDDAPDVVPDPPSRSAAASPASSGETAPAATGDPVPAAAPATSVQLGGRDPFAPLHSEAAPVAAAAPAAGTGTGSTPVTPSDASVVPPVPEAPSGPDVTDPAGPAIGPAVPGDGGATGVSPTVGAPTTVLLTRVTGTGTARSAVLSVDGSASTVEVGGSFGPSGQLQLVSVQEGPEDGQWTAVLRSGDADPFDVVSGVPTRLP